MANICCDDVIFYTEGNPEGLYDLWEDLETYIILNQNPDLCWIGNLFSHKKIDSTGISLRGNVSYISFTVAFIAVIMFFNSVSKREKFSSLIPQNSTPSSPIFSPIKRIFPTMGHPCLSNS